MLKLKDADNNKKCIYLHPPHIVYMCNYNDGETMVNMIDNTALYVKESCEEILAMMEKLKNV